MARLGNKEVVRMAAALVASKIFSDYVGQGGVLEPESYVEGWLALNAPQAEDEFEGFVFKIFIELLWSHRFKK